MAPQSPTQLASRGRIEAVLRLAAPLLAAGDRLSRAADRDELAAAPPPRPLPPGPARRPAAPGPREQRPA